MSDGMCQALLWSMFVLIISMPIALTADLDPAWSIETLQDGGLIELIYRDYIAQGNKIQFAELGFHCERKRLNEIRAHLFPFQGTYDNRQQDVPVLIEPEHNAPDSTSLGQKWINGFNYIYLNQPEVGKLVQYLKQSEKDGVESVNVFFSGDFNGHTEKLLKVVVELSGFTDGFVAFAKACAP
jgi:hypothetical protein